MKNQQVQLLILLPILMLNTLFAQQWSEPVNISNHENLDNIPDMFIDDNGYIHCVWMNKIESNYWKIHYSKSTDDGNNWSSPVDASLNSSLWVSNPHIVVDSNNFIHLTYDYNVGSPGSTIIVYKKNIAGSWPQIWDTVSTGWPGARHNHLIIDNNDKIYCFWFSNYQNGTAFYRTLENGLWGEIVIPYDDNDLYYFADIVSDTYDNLHCTGNHIYSWQPNYDDEVIYLSFINEIWSDFTEISFENEIWDGNDITLDTNDLPQIVWRQTTSNSIPANDGTLLSKYDGTNWSYPELIVEDPAEQKIVIDENNRINIFDVEKTENGCMLVHYYKKNNVWEGTIIDTSEANAMPKLKVKNYNSKIYVAYVKPIPGTNNGEIFFTKRNIITVGTKNYNSPNLKLNIYPNPFARHTTISYEIPQSNNVIIKIYNLKGQLVNTISNKTQSPGVHQIVWNGTDKNGKEVNAGLYLVRLKAGRQILTRSVEIIK